MASRSTLGDITMVTPHSRASRASRAGVSQRPTRSARRLGLRAMLKDTPMNTVTCTSRARRES